MMPQPATLRHIPRLLGILWSFTRATPWLPVCRSRWVDAHLMGRVIRRGWVRQVGDAKGTAGFIARHGEVIHALYVHPRARGRGVGRTLLDEAKAGRDRLQLWVLAANEQARAFYAAQGFEEVLCGCGMGNDENLPDILMVWQAEAQSNERQAA
ncbi:GNAT family N-acetyltransferase [Roseovarius sp. 2305UL8-3]|uniref:GNAT family N-acetyltransferase n=1 Tax=Roseovarius conchicola TaxID=3121636 RepID=UPI003526DA88